ncbi:MAG: hypothetical protein OCD01_04470 [Fibrobacterales bacterium]
MKSIIMYSLWIALCCSGCSSLFGTQDSESAALSQEALSSAEYTNNSDTVFYLRNIEGGGSFESAPELSSDDEYGSSEQSHVGDDELYLFNGTYLPESTEYEEIFVDNYNSVFQSLRELNDDILPQDSFRAFYFNGTYDHPRIWSRVVQNPWRFYRDSFFNNIHPKKFSAFYAGLFTFSEEELYQFHVEQGNALALIRIDGEVVYDGSVEDDPFVHSFKAGTHRIECEIHIDTAYGEGSVFVTEVSTVNYLIWFTPIQEKVSMSTIQKFRAEHPKAKLWYVGATPNERSRNRIELVNTRLNQEAIIFLTSAKEVEWDFNFSQMDYIKGIVVSSHMGQPTVINIPDDIPIYYIDAFPLLTNMEQLCLSEYCPSNPFKKTLIDIVSDYNLVFHYFCGSIRGEHVEIPRTQLSGDAYIIEEQDTLTRITAEEVAARRKATIYMDLDDPETFGDRIYDPGYGVPTDKFENYYFNYAIEKTGLLTRSMSEIKLDHNYWNDYQGFPVDQFASYWRRDYEFFSDTTLYLRAQHTNADVRILVDKKVVYKEYGNGLGVVHSFKRGRHTLEIEYINRSEECQFEFKLESVE